MSLPLNSHEIELVEQGWTIIDDIVTDDEAEIALKEFGVLIPQYNGKIRYEVAASKQHEQRAFSKSVNSIPWHVDAPSWEPTPSRMAMHCRRQATCGGGHTDIADFRYFISQLDEKDRTPLYERELHWIERNTREGIRRPIVEVLPGGREVIRYRHSLLLGNSDPRLVISDEHRGELGEYGRRIARLAEEFFAEHTNAVLVPENSILVFDNQRMVHRRRGYRDPNRRLTRYWMADLAG